MRTLVHVVVGSALVTLGLMVATAAPALADELVVNGSFELGSYDPNSHDGSFNRIYAGSTAITGWTIGGYSVDWHTEVELWYPQDGDYLVDLNRSGTGLTGTVSQDLPTVPGRTYELSFYLAGVRYWGPTRTVDVTIDGNLQSFTVAASWDFALQWYRQTATFTATSNSTTLTFSSPDPTGFWGPLLDNISVRTILPDSDGDGLPDLWETEGYTHDNGTFVDLPAMGADPARKDVFVEIDYAMGITPPQQAGLDLVIAAFAAAPVDEPNGITLHCFVDDAVDFAVHDLNGDGILGTGGVGTYDWTEFDVVKAAHFPEELEWAFHYCVFADRTSAANSGISRGIEASDFIVSLGAFAGGGTTWQHAGTFMHELGHNLGLGHGGNDDINGKPNYLSIMNKPFQMQGLRTLDGNGEAQDGLFDYSRQKIDLDENAITESLGLGPSAPSAYATTWFRYDIQHWTTDPGASAGPVNAAIDWDVNGLILPVATALDVTDDGAWTVLDGHDDWSNLVFTGGRVGGGGVELPQVTEVGGELTLEEAQQLGLAPPTKLHGHVADGQKIVLTWKPVGPKMEASYRIYRGLPGGQPVPIGNTDNSNFEDHDLVAGTTYTYLVRVVNALGVESSQVAIVHVTAAE